MLYTSHHTHSDALYHASHITTSSLNRFAYDEVSLSLTIHVYSDQATYASSLPPTDHHHRNFKHPNDRAASQPYSSCLEGSVCDPMTSENLATHNAAMASAETTIGGLENAAESERVRRLGVAAQSLGFELPDCCLPVQHRGHTPLEIWLFS